MLFSELTATVTIAPPTISFSNATPYTYNGSNQSPGYTQNSCYGTGVTITYVVLSSSFSYSGFGPPIYEGNYRMDVRIDGGTCNAQVFSTSFTITKLPITLTASTNTKVYDGTISAAATPTITLGSLASGDVGTYSETYDTKSQGIGKTLTPNVISILDATSVSMVGNYSITYAIKTDGEITKKSITLTASTNTKVYDGTISAAATPTITLGSLASGDVGTYSETYDTKGQGTGKTLTPSVISILDATSVSMVGNYSITYATKTDGVITAKQLTIADPTITKSKEYDKTVTAAVTAGTLSGVVTVGASTDDATITAAGTYSTSTVGTGKTITVVYTLAGVDKDNYLKPVNKVYTDGVITAKPLTISDPAITKSKEYDKTVTAAVTAGTLSGVVTVGASTDDATITAAGTYSTSTVATGKTITVVYTLAGVDKDNYIQPINKVYTDGVITAKQLISTTATIASRVYDGTKTVGAITKGTLTGYVGTETLVVTAAGSDYSSANVGTYSSTISYTLADGDNGGLAVNYTLASETANGKVTSKALTINANSGQKKTYGANDPATYNYTVSPTIAGLASLIGNLSRDVGEHVNDYAILQNTITSANNPNYTISFIGNNFTIEKKLINVIAVSKSKNYNTDDPILTYTFIPTPLVATDVFSGVLQRIAGETAGVYDINQGSLSLSSDYLISFTKGLLTILPETNVYFQIPNAFVPGSLNEFDNKFRIFSNTAFPANLLTSFRIFNRSGQLVKTFTGNPPITDSWDGKGPDGSLLESDVYIWVATFMDDPLTKNIPRSGTFLLLK